MRTPAACYCLIGLAITTRLRPRKPGWTHTAWPTATPPSLPRRPVRRFNGEFAGRAGCHALARILLAARAEGAAGRGAGAIGRRAALQTHDAAYGKALQRR